MGNSKWEKKVIEIEALTLEKSPDILFISEANMWGEVPDYQKKVNGYDLYIPEAMMAKHGYARLVLLAREGLEITIEEGMMHEDIYVIWLTMNYTKRKKNSIGGVYREHQLLFKEKPNPTKADPAQLERWNNVIKGWKAAAAKGRMCTLIGDTNLDYLRWETPETSHQKMVATTKDEMETMGFTQAIKGHTRSWRGQNDSLVDQCWLNFPDRLI